MLKLLTREQIEHMASTNADMKKKKYTHTNEAKEKISIANKGSKRTKKQIANIVDGRNYVRELMKVEDIAANHEIYNLWRTRHEEPPFVGTEELDATSVVIDYENELIADYNKKYWEFVMELLEKRESEVIKMRFEDEMTLEEISKILNVTRERIRQIEAKALRRLKHPVHAEFLKYHPIYNNVKCRSTLPFVKKEVDSYIFDEDDVNIPNPFYEVYSFKLDIVDPIIRKNNEDALIRVIEEMFRFKFENEFKYNILSFYPMKTVTGGYEYYVFITEIDRFRAHRISDTLSTILNAYTSCVTKLTFSEFSEHKEKKQIEQYFKTVRETKPVVKKQIPKIDIHKECRYSYSSFPIYVWAGI